MLFKILDFDSYIVLAIIMKFIKEGTTLRVRDVK